MATSDDAGSVVAFPSMGLTGSLWVEPIDVACASEEEDIEVTFPVTVATGEPASNGKYKSG